MRFFVLILSAFFFFITVATNSQLISSPVQDKHHEKENLKFWSCGVIETPAYPDSLHWKNHLIQYMQPDSLALDTIPTGKYTVAVHFIIDTSGKLNFIRIEKEPGFGFGDRLKKIIETYPLLWVPAWRNGRKVKDFRRQQVTFIMEEEEEECEEVSFTKLIL